MKAMQVSTSPELVEKEVISTLSFKDKSLVDQHPDLRNQLKNATRLGNGYHTKVSIVFQDDESLKRVDTTIWAHGNKYICLKGGTWLPVSRILEVKS